MTAAHYFGTKLLGNYLIEKKNQQLLLKSDLKSECICRGWLELQKWIIKNHQTEENTPLILFFTEYKIEIERLE
jgi:hypothetical protein